MSDWITSKNYVGGIDLDPLTQEDIKKWTYIAQEFKDAIKNNSIPMRYSINNKVIAYFLNRAEIKSLDLYFYVSIHMFLKYMKAYYKLQKEYDRCNGISGCKRQQLRIKGGVKPAYNYDIKVDTIIELKERGMSNEQIARELNTSRSTIWRRLKEGNKSKV